ncbi:MAG: SDR family oxidoreductase [Pseudomonadota bacterium]
MDMNIRGRKAIVCGASKGLGRACAEALAAEGVDVTIAARTPDAIEQAAKDIAKATGAKVTPVAADVTTEAGRKALLAACPSPDILVNNAGGPPAGDFRTWDRDTWIAALDANMLSAIELIRATVDPMIERKWGRIVNITSHMVKQPVGFLGLSNGARAGLTGFVSGLSRDVAGGGVTINNMLPGAFDTDRLKTNQDKVAKMRGQESAAVREGFRQSIPAQRFGTPDEFGATCAFLCSQHAGYITGQNILLDGGTYPGLM